jgi:hypothetical protein
LSASSWATLNVVWRYPCNFYHLGALDLEELALLCGFPYVNLYPEGFHLIFYFLISGRDFF